MSGPPIPSLGQANGRQILGERNAHVQLTNNGVPLFESRPLCSPKSPFRVLFPRTFALHLGCHVSITARRIPMIGRFRP